MPPVILVIERRLVLVPSRLPIAGLARDWRLPFVSHLISLALNILARIGNLFPTDGTKRAIASLAGPGASVQAINLRGADK